MTGGNSLEHFELCRLIFSSNPAFSEIDLHSFKLFVGELADPDFAVGGNAGADAFEVDFSVFFTGAMAVVDGVLHHGKAVFEQVFAEASVAFACFRGVSWEVEEDNEPHGSIS